MRISFEELAAGAPHLSVGLHAADMLRLGDELAALERAGIRLIHLDVMDGRFCPQMTFGPLVVAAVGGGFVKDVHLMVREPLGKLEDYVEAGASMITFHLESTSHPHRALAVLAGSGVIRGVALNPGTPVAWLEPLLDDLEFVLVLAIDPGWGAQLFTPATAGRVAAVRRLIAGRPVLVGIDGGVTTGNMAEVAAMGSEVIVSGSAVFASGDTEVGASALLEVVRSVRPPLLTSSVEP